MKHVVFAAEGGHKNYWLKKHPEVYKDLDSYIRQVCEVAARGYKIPMMEFMMENEHRVERESIMQSMFHEYKTKLKPCQTMLTSYAIVGRACIYEFYWMYFHRSKRDFEHRMSKYHKIYDERYLKYAWKTQLKLQVKVQEGHGRIRFFGVPVAFRKDNWHYGMKIPAT